MPKKRYCYCRPPSCCCDFTSPSEKELSPYIKILKILMKRRAQIQKNALRNLVTVLACFKKKGFKLPRYIRMTILCLNEERCTDLAIIPQTKLKNIPTAFHKKLKNISLRFAMEINQALTHGENCGQQIKEIIVPERHGPPPSKGETPV